MLQYNIECTELCSSGVECSTARTCQEPQSSRVFEHATMAFVDFRVFHAVELHQAPRITAPSTQDTLQHNLNMRLLSRLLTGATKFDETGNQLPMIFDHRVYKKKRREPAAAAYSLHLCSS